MNQEKNRKRVAFIQLFCIFFLLIAFVLTSSMALFMTYLGNAVQIEFTAQNIGAAATVAAPSPRRHWRCSTFQLQHW